jgi:hypothetical protein
LTYNIQKIIKVFEKKIEFCLKNILPKAIPKVGGCGLCYPVCTPKRYLKTLNRKTGRDTDKQRNKKKKTKRGVEEQ